jgi:hypothetical protein
VLGAAASLAALVHRHRHRDRATQRLPLLRATGGEAVRYWWGTGSLPLPNRVPRERCVIADQLLRICDALVYSIHERVKRGLARKPVA